MGGILPQYLQKLRLLPDWCGQVAHACLHLFVAV